MVSVAVEEYIDLAGTGVVAVCDTAATPTTKNLVHGAQVVRTIQAQLATMHLRTGSAGAILFRASTTDGRLQAGGYRPRGCDLRSFPARTARPGSDPPLAWERLGTFLARIDAPRSLDEARCQRRERVPGRLFLRAPGLQPGCGLEPPPDPCGSDIAMTFPQGP